MYAHWDCELCPWWITFSLRGKLTSSLFVCLFLHHSFLLHPLPRLLLLPLITHEVEAGKHWTKFWINRLIIPYNITATPNLADTHTQTQTLARADTHLCGLSLMLPLGCSWQMTALLICQPRVSCSAGCVCVCVLQEGGKIVEGHGEMEGSTGKTLALWLVEVNILQSYGFLTEKMVCFDHVAQQTMKNRLFSCYLSANQVFVIFFTILLFRTEESSGHKRGREGCKMEDKRA